EPPRFVEKFGQVERGPANVVRRRAIRQQREARKFVGLVFELIGLLDRFAGGLLTLVVIGDGGFVLQCCFGVFAAGLVNAANQVAGVRAESGIGEEFGTI